MRKQDAIFACEHSGHFYFRDNYYADSVWLALRQVVAAMEISQKSLRELLLPYQCYTQTEEVLLRVQDKKQVLETLATKHKSTAERVVRYDGVSVYYPDYWFVVKPSVTEDALKFVVEAPKSATARAMKQQLHSELVALDTKT
jgi:phosphomannomutase